jgi:GTPase SAR1 family protein
MPSELEALRARAEDVATLASGRPEAHQARRLADRLGAGRFHVAVVGEFKRGKSTLVNALLGEDILPTGVLPLTAVSTELSFGDPGVVVEFLDGDTLRISSEHIGVYVTEAGNPGNGRGVARVEVRGRWPLVEPGVVLVDTPGIASLHQHNTEAGRAALLDADGAVVVLSADAPLSEQERDLLGVLAERRSPTFFVLNKSDHLGDDELDEVQEFVTKTLADVLGAEVRVFAVDARTALATAAATRRDRQLEGLEFSEFAAELSRFISDDLVAARYTSACRELARLGSSLSEAIAIEQAARRVAESELITIVERFRGEAERQRRGFDDDRTLLARDTASLVDAVGISLSEFARKAPSWFGSSLSTIAAQAPRSRLADDLRAAIQSAVETAVDEFRHQELDMVEEHWGHLAEDFHARVQVRVDTTRQVATELFDVPLPHLEVPQIAGQTDHFSFLFLHVGSVTEPLRRAASRLVPGRWGRRKALAHARDELAMEFDKHAGRARWDLAQRLEAVRRELERAMRTELEGSIEGIVQAAERAQRWQAEAKEARDREDDLALRLQDLGADLVALSVQTNG